MIKRLIACLLLLFCGFSAIAERIKVQDMVGYCKAPTESHDLYFCMGQADGVMQAIVTETYIRKTNKVAVPGAFDACPPKFLTVAQLIQVFLNWANRHPADWQLTSGLGFATAFSEAYPCH